MQGNPLRELILVLVLVAVMAPVIVRMTRAPETPDAGHDAGYDSGHAGRQSAQTQILTTIRMQFAHPPTEAKLSHRGKSILKVVAAQLGDSYEGQLELDLSEGFVEMPIEVSWPTGTPRTAVTVTFEPEGLEARETTFWSEGDLHEWIELHWNE